MTVERFIHKPRGRTVLLLVGLLLAIALSVTVRVSQAATAPSLGTAGSFAVLGSTTVTNTGPTVVTGDLGVAPGSAVTGFPPGIVVGTIYAGIPPAPQAQADATVAYNNLAGQACNINLTGQDLGGMTLTPGVYCFSSSAQLTGILTLDGLGDPGAVWVFQIGSTITTASASSVLIINGGNACNVFWQVGSSATLGTTTAFQGNILALTSITATTGATVTGRLLALNGAVTMDTNTVTAANCGVPNNTSTPTSTNTPVNTSTPTPTNTPVNTSTPTPTNTPVNTSTPTPTNTPVNTATPTPTNTPVVNNICPEGEADNQRTVILGKGMGNDNTHKNVLKIVIPNWQTVDALYGQLAAEENGKAKYVRFIYPNSTYEQVITPTSPAYRQWAVTWYGADLDPAANISGRWFLQKSGTKGHIPRAFLLYPTYHTAEPYVNVFDPLAFDESILNHVYYNVSAGWIASQQYRMVIPAPLQAVTIVVQVALVENDRDNRPLQLTVSADGATPQTVSPTGPSHGDLLNIVTFSMTIPAGTDEIVLDLVSPNSTGDSGSMIGATAHYACIPPG